jgi:hypothetical protein
MKLFISYSRDDKAWVYDFAQKLKDDPEYEVWIDRRLVGADQWWESILEAVEWCDCFIVVLSPKCVASIFCAAELDYALALNKPILPLVLKDCNIPASILSRQIQYEDLSNTATVDNALIRCERALNRVQRRLDQGRYLPPSSAPDRPPVPEPEAVYPEHVYEVYTAAEEAAAEGNLSLAEELYAKVMNADPHGLGVSAGERRVQIRQEQMRFNAYAHIAQLVEKKLVPGAEAAWRNYVKKYGSSYDPQGLASLLSEDNGASPTDQLQERNKAIHKLRRYGITGLGAIIVVLLLIVVLSAISQRPGSGLEQTHGSTEQTKQGGLITQPGSMPSEHLSETPKIPTTTP